MAVVQMIQELHIDRVSSVLQRASYSLSIVFIQSKLSTAAFPETSPILFEGLIV